jgi:hypothetical protein
MADATSSIIDEVIYAAEANSLFSRTPFDT